MDRLRPGRVYAGFYRGEQVIALADGDDHVHFVHHGDTHTKPPHVLDYLVGPLVLLHVEPMRQELLGDLADLAMTSPAVQALAYQIRAQTHTLKETR